MKKTLFLIICLLVSSGASAALRNGPYLTVRNGLDYTQFKYSGEKESDTSYMWDIAFGVRLKNFRPEIELVDVPRYHLRKEGLDTEIEQQRYMLQFYYDLPIRSALRPFINLGAGASYIDVTSKDLGVSESGDDITFTWNAGLGLGLNVTRHLSFDLGYRYIDAGKAQFFKGSESVKVQNHEGYFGVRYTF